MTEHISTTVWPFNYYAVLFQIAYSLIITAFFMVQLSHPYMTTGKNVTLTIWLFVGKEVSLLFSMLSVFVIAFLPRSKDLFISLLLSRWL